MKQNGVQFASQDPHSYSLYFDMNIWFRARKVVVVVVVFFFNFAHTNNYNTLHLQFITGNCYRSQKRNKKKKKDKVHKNTIVYILTIKRRLPALWARKVTETFEKRVLIHLVEGWRHARDDKLVVSLLSTDMSKAFDSLHPPLLLSKLNAYGFESSTVRLLESYLWSQLPGEDWGPCQFK